MSKENIQRVQFQDLIKESTSYNGEKIIMTGFLYHDSKGTAILSAEPNLKSCCVGSDSKRLQQVIVFGDDLPKSENIAVTLSGNLFTESSHFGYRIYDAKITDRASDQWPIGSLITLAIGIIVSIILVRWRQQNRFKGSP